jgi:hypothetical protein
MFTSRPRGLIVHQRSNILGVAGMSIFSCAIATMYSHCFGSNGEKY